MVILATMILIAGAAAVRRTDAPPPYPLKQAIIVGSLSTLPDHLADRAGIYLRHGIQVEFTPVTNVVTATQALAAGRVEVSVLDIPNDINAREAGFDVVFIVGHWGRTINSIVCQKSLNLMSDTAPPTKVDTTYPAIMQQLIGKRVGVNVLGGPPDTYLRITLLDSGIDPSKVNIISTGSTGATAAAIASGALDCAVMGEPDITALSSATTTILNYMIGQGPAIFRDHYGFSMIGTTPTFAAAHPTLVRNLAEALIDSERMICGAARSKAGAAKITEFVAPDYPSIEVSTLAQVIQNIAPAACNSWHIGRDVVGGAVQVWDRLNPTDKALWPYGDFIAPQVVDLTAPSVKLSTPVRNGTKVTLTWTGVDKVGPYDVSDIASGVKSYTVQTRTDGDRWITRLDRKDVTACTLHVPLAGKLEVRVRARDRAGNNGAWVEAAA